MYKGRGAGGKGRSRSYAPSPQADCPPLVVHGGTEGRVGEDHVSSELALLCAQSGMDTPPGDAGAMALGALEGRFVGGGGGGGLLHWQPHKEQTSLAAVAQVRVRRGPGRPRTCALRAALCTVRCRLSCTVCRTLCSLVLCTVCGALSRTVRRRRCTACCTLLCKVC